MPNTELPAPLVAELQAERYGMPIIDASRSRLIAALHALINWIIEHPDVPVPHSVELYHHPLVAGGCLTKVDLIDLAATLGGEVGSNGSTTWMRAQLLAAESGARVDYVAFEGDAAANRRAL